MLYCGVHGIIEGSTPENILDNLGSLISDLKEKNNKMKTYVCQVVPTPMSQDIQAKIADYNEHLTKWGDTNGLAIIKTALSFKLGTGELDDLCCNMEIGNISALNRLGIIRLLATIKSQCTDF